MTQIRIGARWIAAGLVGGCLAIGGAAGAEAQETNWYIGGTLPLMFIDDSDTENTTTIGQGENAPTLSSTIKSEHSTGFKFGGSVGYHFEGGIRVEGELFYAQAKIDTLTNTQLTLTGLQLPIELPQDVDLRGSGTAKQLGGMVNVFYDFDVGDDLTPYVGGGIGMVRIDQSDVKYDTNAVKDEIAQRIQNYIGGLPQQAQLPAQQQLGPALAQFDVDVPEPSGTDTVFAWQLGAGLGYAMTDTLTLQLGYRLQAVDGLEFTGTNDGAMVRAETDLLIHFLEIGVRQRF